jgi:hypothetical protein
MTKIVPFPPHKEDSLLVETQNHATQWTIELFTPFSYLKNEEIIFEALKIQGKTIVCQIT